MFSKRSKNGSSAVSNMSVMKISALSIGIALLLDLLCYILAKRSDLFHLLFRALNL